MAIMCLECYQVYEISNVKFDKFKEHNFCPKFDCYGKIIDVDELFVPVIKILNTKRYFTKYCCSSHCYDLHNTFNAYIMFEENVKLPKILPKNFKRDGNNTIRKSFENLSEKSEVILHEEILQTTIDVLRWANSLPFLKG